MVEAFPLIEISGDPTARGRSYGEQASRQIRLGIDHYSAQFERLKLDAKTLAAVITDYLPVIQAFDQDYLDEMRGIAEGAGVTFEQVFMINARSEVLKIAANPKLRETLLSSHEGDGCTGVIVMPQATREGQIIHAQNWDWKHECVESSVVLKVRRDDGPDVLTFTEAGALARSGVNANGTAITANYLEADIDFRQIGVPLPLIRRKALEAENLALALRAVYTTAKSGSNNMMISHAGGIGLNFECAPTETFVLRPENGMLVHANHWLSPIALGKLKDLAILGSPDTLYRDMRVRDLLLPRVGDIGMDDVRAALLDDFESPWSVCRPPRLNLASNLSATVACILIRPVERTMQIAPLPALPHVFTSYGL